MVLAASIGFVAFIVVYADATDLVEPDGPGSAVLAVRILLDLALGIAALVMFPFRRRAPLAIVIAIVLISSASALSIGAALLGVVSISTRRRWREILPVSVLLIGAALVVEIAFPSGQSLPWWQLAVFIIVVTGALVVTGMYIGGRRQLRAALVEQASSARREQQAQLEQAHANERGRIAREMHDVLAHRLSLVALHAGALEYRVDLSAEQIKTTAGVVRSNAHLALTELREVLGVLRDPSSAGSAQDMLPQPTLADLTGLLDESSAAGSSPTLEVDSAVAVALDSLPDSASRHLYRIIQEGLTNARKHAPGQPILVNIGGDPDHRVTLTLSNPPAPERRVAPASPTSGLGLLGLRERVRLAGGELTAVNDASLFILEAWLPWKK